MGQAGFLQSSGYLRERLFALRANLVWLTWWLGACSLLCQLTGAVDVLRKGNLHPRGANFQRGVGDRARPEDDLRTFFGGLAAALLRIDFPGSGVLASSGPSEPRFAAVRLNPDSGLRAHFSGDPTCQVSDTRVRLALRVVASAAGHSL